MSRCLDWNIKLTCNPSASLFNIIIKLANFVKRIKQPRQEQTLRECFSNGIVSVLQRASRDFVRPQYLTRHPSANWFNFDWACQPCQHNEALAPGIGTSRFFSNGIVSFLQCTWRSLARNMQLTRHSPAICFNFDKACPPLQHNEGNASGHF